ncbi:formate dehydrogenase accessory sulfurtransferase FdhD [Noviherbaspirillum suwonense]|jgi:formate dehydrogenase accessory protein FdhD|uniref:Sulfur carrier protein FdhD n=1 Tax=Noviherbaspirillum suwonense TaxID=1224511 RepID=A0ABY1Q0W5_9BURK|nr:formate dehydrogenase accessory sulfurtransferase FdhD [Noviherbaspirillum suwonense]SMP52405.1 FdhD protein [Noviherbaspirillum suwonense]
MNCATMDTLPEASCQVVAWRHGLAATETVVEEVPVALVYNGISHAVLLATPMDLEDFALGFSLGEGILAGASDLYDMDVQQSAQGIALQMTIASGAMHALKLRRRSLAGRTGCGLCGTESLDQVARPIAPVQAGGSVSAPALHAAMSALKDRQVLHQATGAVHAAGWAGWDGRLQLAREDVGRHNALDKLIGALAYAGIDPRDGFAVVTSRASFEMVHKAAAAGIRLLAAISAPTAMAVRLAEQGGLTLAGFVRQDRQVVYAHAQRVRMD